MELIVIARLRKRNEVGALVSSLQEAGLFTTKIKKITMGNYPGNDKS